jgi:glycine/D-amino acid oxidase-like deaminating enzyme
VATATPRGGIFHPDFKAMPYWWEAWQPQREAEVDPPASTEIAIVGGGYGGLNTALELARGGVEATVFESQDFGFGASTRNGGQISPGTNLGKGLGGAKAAGDAAKREALKAALLADGSQSFALLEDIIKRESIQCFYERSGRFSGAYTPKHYEALAEKLALYNSASDAEAEMVPRERQREEIASDFYYGGMKVNRSGKLHPALYYKGLLEACRRHKIKLVPRCDVGRIAGKRDAFTLTTPRGEVRAKQVVIATNGYTTDLTPQLKRRLIPVASHIIATEELPEDLANSLIPNGRTISDTPRILTYFRMSPDGKRMLFGGRARFTAVGPEVTAPILHRFMTDRFPQLAGAKVTHAWTGNVAFAFDFLPHMGESEGMHYCLACNGSGVAMMSYLGYQTARKIIGGGNRVTSFEEIDFPERFGYSGNPWFLPVVGAWYRLRDRIDRVLS